MCTFAPPLVAPPPVLWHMPPQPFLFREPPTRTPFLHPPCPHKDMNDHKRLRMKNGLVHLVCLRCGMKWKKASKSHSSMHEPLTITDDVQLALISVGRRLVQAAEQGGASDEEAQYGEEEGVPEPAELLADDGGDVAVGQPWRFEKDKLGQPDWSTASGLSAALTGLLAGSGELSLMEAETEALISEACTAAVAREAGDCRVADGYAHSHTQAPCSATFDPFAEAAASGNGGAAPPSIATAAAAPADATPQPSLAITQPFPLPLAAAVQAQAQQAPLDVGSALLPSSLWSEFFPADGGAAAAPLPIVYVPPLCSYGPLLRCPNITNPYHWCSLHCHDRWNAHERLIPMRPPCYNARFGDGCDAPKPGVFPILPPGYKPSSISVEVALQALEPLVNVSAVLRTAEHKVWELQNARLDAPPPHIIRVINTYTQDSPLYTVVNTALREFDAQVLPLCRDYVYFLTLALLRMPVVNTGCVYRALRTRVLSKWYQPGALVTWQALSSAALYPAVLLGSCFGGSAQPQGTVFVVHVAHARSIRLCSANPSEEEVILPPNSHFQVLSVPATHAAKAALLPDLESYDLTDLIVYELQQVIPAPLQKAAPTQPSA